MALEKSLQAAQRSIPECIAAGYVDMVTGMLLAVRTVDSHPTEILDLVAAATAELFQGPRISEIEQAFHRARKEEGRSPHYLQEIVVLSRNLIHVFLRGRRFEDHAAVFVCRSTANLGMVLTRSRLALPAIEAAL